MGLLVGLVTACLLTYCFCSVSQTREWGRQQDTNTIFIINHTWITCLWISWKTQILSKLHHFGRGQIENILHCMCYFQLLPPKFGLVRYIRKNILNKAPFFFELINLHEILRYRATFLDFGVFWLPINIGSFGHTTFVHFLSTISFSFQKTNQPTKDLSTTHWEGSETCNSINISIR